MSRVPIVVLLLCGLVLLAACQPTVGLSPRIAPLPEVPLQGAPIVADEQGRSLVPAAAQGRVVYERVCAQCHGVEGRGDGPLAAFLKAPQKNPFTDTMRLLGLDVKGEDLPSRPANFHNQVQMRLNSPTNMYEVVTLGRPHTAMPAFGPKPAYGANDGIPGPRFLGETERWNVVFYEWTFATSPESIARGRQLFQEREFPVSIPGLGRVRATCASCHGADGDGRGGAYSQVMARRTWGWRLGRGPGIFRDRDFMVKRKPSELFAWIYDGIGLMPPYKQFLTVEEIWSLVDYIWTFVYTYTPPRGQQP
ncbi:MAG: c-type cytochrome [Armatimonadota bacterium]|nr:c-type cytochrome [Armatimonadota bacterium]MDR7463141.1 c-type cytochrome [Armatimonadota bacterium]MDR7468872.1 c-type cytochrome [Armatimonadota bacterium]MDR7474887.1 c-type cytochrome [Armatimonadota bacterium]MDR7539662.1 c-type cytochrome [Armatimonadota bacterium]